MGKGKGVLQIICLLLLTLKAHENSLLSCIRAHILHLEPKYISLLFWV
jgi:hypothetical protein